MFLDHICGNYQIHQLVIGDRLGDIEVGCVYPWQVHFSDRVRIQPEVKLPPINFDLDLKVDSQIDRLGFTDLVGVKQESQVKPRLFVLDPLEDIRS